MAVALALAPIAASSGPLPQATDVGIGIARGVAVDAAGNIYVASESLAMVVRIDRAGRLTILAGGSPPGPSFPVTVVPAAPLPFKAPAALALDRTGGLLVVDRERRAVQRLDLATGAVRTIVGPAGDGTGLLLRPAGIAVESDGRILVSDSSRHRVYRIEPSTGVGTPVVGGGLEGHSGDGGPAIAARLAFPEGLALDGKGALYIADRGNGAIRRVDLKSGQITTATRDVAEPLGVAIDANGRLLIADAGGHRVCRLEKDGRLNVVAAGEKLTPHGLAVSAAGDLLVADIGGRVVQRLEGGTLRVIAGNGQTGACGDRGPATVASLRTPRGLAVDARGNVYVSDTGHHRIRRIDAGTGLITTIAGTGGPGTQEDGGPAAEAQVDDPTRLAFDAAGDLVFIDAASRRIRRISAAGLISTVAVLIDSPGVLAPGPDGGMFVAGRWVSQIDPSGGVVELRVERPAPEAATDASHFPQGWPRDIGGIAVEPNGNLLLADGLHGCIWRWERDARSLVRVFPAEASEIGPFGWGAGVARAPDGALWISAPRHRSVFRLAPDAVRPSVVVGGGNGRPGPGEFPSNEVGFIPAAVAFGPTGQVYVLAAEGHVWQLDPAAGRVRVIVGGGSAIEPPVRDQR